MQQISEGSSTATVSIFGGLWHSHGHHRWLVITRRVPSPHRFRKHLLHSPRALVGEGTLSRENLVQTTEPLLPVIMGLVSIISSFCILPSKFPFPITVSSAGLVACLVGCSNPPFMRHLSSRWPCYFQPRVAIWEGSLPAWGHGSTRYYPDWRLRLCLSLIAPIICKKPYLQLLVMVRWVTPASLVISGHWESRVSWQQL